MECVTRTTWLASLMAMALVLVLNTASASALTICISPCDPLLEPLPSIVTVDPLDLPDFPTTDVSGLILGSGDALGPYNVVGDLVLHVSSGSLVAEAIDIRAGGTLSVQISTVAADTINLCTVECAPFDTEIPGFAADPFHLAILGPLTGALEVFATGDILVTADPIPESATAILIAFGLSALAAHQPRSLT